MRSIFIGVFLVAYISMGLAAQAPFPNRTAAVNCSSATAVTGCEVCSQVGQAFICTQSAAGYYINAKDQAVACPRSCETCELDEVTGEAQCQKCQGDGFDEIKQDNYTECTQCKSGYTLDDSSSSNSENLFDSSPINGVCIRTDALGEYSCVSGQSWSQAPGLNRKCIKQDQNCTARYSSSLDGTNTKAENNCNYCAVNNTLVATKAVNGNKLSIIQYTCDTAKAPAEKPEVKDCSDGVNSTTSCKECNNETNLCKTPNLGFYILPSNTSRILSVADNAAEGKLGACPVQCNNCAANGNLTTCLACTDPDHSKLVDGNCVCTKGYAPSIPLALANTAGQSYQCVQLSSFYTCTSPYVWNSPIQIDSTQATEMSLSQCISQFDNSTCYKDALTTEQSLTSYWDRAPSNKRQCTLATQRSCAPYYAQKQGDASSSYKDPLTQDCNACIDGFSISGQSNDEVCSQNQSGILALSLALFGLISVILF